MIARSPSKYMNAALFSRALGFCDSASVQQTESAKLLHCLSIAPEIVFDGRLGAEAGAPSSPNNAKTAVSAHRAGINCLAIEKFDSRM